jgi:hypothetical protein
MQGTFFGTGAPFGSVGQPTAWSGPSFGAQGVSPLGPQGVSPFGAPVAPQQLVQLLQFVPQQLQKLQQLEYLQQQQLQQLQLLLQVIPQQLHYIHQTIQYLPQQIQQYQQLGTAGHAAINPFQSTGVPFGATPQLWSQGLSPQTGQVM